MGGDGAVQSVRSGYGAGRADQNAPFAGGMTSFPNEDIFDLTR